MRRVGYFTLFGTAAAIIGATAFSVYAASAADNVEWRGYEGGNAAQHYSPLTQINKKTVSKLEVAWSYKLDRGTSVSNPLIIDGVMYIVGSGAAIVALDAETGRELWSKPNAAPGRTRGIAYWESPDRSDRRILYVKDQNIQALDARTGADVTSFGDNGKIDLRLGLGRDNVRSIQPGSPGRVYKNLIVMGSGTGEDYDAPPGDIRAYDILTGKLAWTFHTIPHPGEAGYEEWKPDAYKTVGGANAWGGLAVDDARGIVYIPLGSANYDFYGAGRLGSNRYANSLVALDANSGKLLWHFQTVHHDLWDYDLTATPVLLTVRQNGKPVDVVVQAGKTGFLYVFDRVTGKPLWPIEERPVPQSDVPGEVSAPTQPFPTVIPPFVRQMFKPEDVDPRLSPTEYADVQAKLRSARNLGIFTPPAVDKDVIQMPGSHGGANWGSTGAEPNNGRFYVVGYDYPGVLNLQMSTSAGPTDGLSPMAAGETLYKANCQVCHGAQREGTGGVPELRQVGERLPPADIKRVITEGRMTMPAFAGRLQDKDIDNVVAYLTGLAPPPPRRGPPGAPAPTPLAGSTPVYQKLQYRSGYGFMISSLGTPPIKPPWAYIVAYDLNTAKILWRAPIGTSVARGPEPVGFAGSKGGLLITAGGLVFASSPEDRKIHAWDKDSGKQLWEQQLPSGGQGQMSTYSIKGRQYLVVPAAELPPARGTDKPAPYQHSFVVYALPRR